LKLESLREGWRRQSRKKRTTVLIFTYSPFLRQVMGFSPHLESLKLTLAFLKKSGEMDYPLSF